MADLTDIQAAGAVKIVGADSAGSELTPVSASTYGELKACDILNNGGTNASLTVGTSAVELKVGGSRLSNRKMVLIQPLTDKVYFGFSNSVTVANGIPLQKIQFFMFPVGENTQVWLISSSASNDVRIAEIA